MKKFFLKILVWFALKCRLYYVWSKIYRFLYERKYRHVVLPKLNSIEEVEDLIGNISWRKDKWYMLWDAISIPQAAYGRYLDKKAGGDCDDISILAVHLIEDLIKRRKVQNFLQVGLLSVPWLDMSNKVGGHNVCIIKYKMDDKLYYGHISNWNMGRVRWAFTSKEAVVDEIPRGGTTLGWAIADKNLKLKKYSRKV